MFSVCRYRSWKELLPHWHKNHHVLPALPNGYHQVHQQRFVVICWLCVLPLQRWSRKMTSIKNIDNKIKYNSTLASASRAASASAAIALWRFFGSLTSFTSTLWTLTPQGSVATSRVSIMSAAMFSLSDKISPRVFVPNTFLRVVAARSRVDWQ